MTLAHGTDRLEFGSARAAAGRSGRSAVLHAHPRTARSRAGSLSWRPAALARTVGRMVAGNSRELRAARARPSRGPAQGRRSADRALRLDGPRCRNRGTGAWDSQGMVRGRTGAHRHCADLRVRARLHVRPRRLGPGFRNRSGALRSRLRARRFVVVVRGLGHSAAERPLATCRRTVRRAGRRPNGSARSDVGSLCVAACDRRCGAAPACSAKQDQPTWPRAEFGRRSAAPKRRRRLAGKHARKPSTARDLPSPGCDTEAHDLAQRLSYSSWRRAFVRHDGEGGADE